MTHGGIRRIEQRDRPIVGVWQLAEQPRARDGRERPGGDAVGKAPARLRDVVGNGATPAQRYVAIGDGPHLWPGAAIEAEEDVVPVIGDVLARAQIIFGGGLEQPDAQIAEEAHLGGGGERLVLGVPDLGHTKLLQPHVAPQVEPLPVTQMRGQAVRREIDLLHGLA